MKNKIGFNTRAAKTYLDDKKTKRPLTIPILQGTTFEMESSEELGRLFKKGADVVYTRFGNPTITAAAEKCAAIEGSDAAAVFSSGMGAITTSLLAVLKSGDHVVAQKNIFAQTFTFLTQVAYRLGIQTTFVDARNPEEVQQAIRPSTVLVYIESPSNPLLDIVDIRKIVQITKKAGVLLYIDSTFATPFVQRPMELGADVVLHSGSKYFGGHSDLLCGIAAFNTNLIERMRIMQILLGNIMDPHAAWVLLRGIKTLGVRVQRQCENAYELVKFLASHKKVVNVNYPFLETSPYFAVARSQMAHGGGMISFEPVGGVESARKLLNELKLIPVATSLGGVETVIEIPNDLDFSSDEIGDGAKQMAISPALIRLSVGIEEVQDLKQDLQQALEVI
ncbi:MAG TPA: aminotransferase class I/II-fold pyridoxal phosphate-dependent enzyme [Acidobacteriota bacterium]|nr:aminotransferase class I/II-fold pyridoxal phosphate-dependent enzyme [Acidobacteriota bacterium]